MALSGDEIRQRLGTFASKWSVYSGSEIAEAHDFLNELFDCYGQDRQAVAEFEKPQGRGFVDLIWPEVCIIEMKAPAEAKKLATHRKQALGYWHEASDAAKGIKAPRYVVLCAFRTLEVWQPGEFPKEPRAGLDLVDLPDQYDVLLFLAGKQPVFLGGHAAVTREAVTRVTDLYAQLRDRGAAGFDVLRDFILQSVWCMFAEDFGQIPAHRFTQLVHELIANPHRSSADELGGLFNWLNTPGPRPDHGLYAEVPYANGSLFQEPAHVHLEPEELELLRGACEFNWHEVQPQIFGSLLEGGLGHKKQWQLGAHYTHVADIEKIVRPTIVGPWEERIENLETHEQAVAAQTDLMNFVVLDPACGSGNFLYVAYQELRRLEKRLREREAELRKQVGLPAQSAISGLFFPLQNLRGIDNDAYAVALARVTLWMGHKVATVKLGLDESTLPLQDLSGIQAGDALKMPWPKADVIIGNPPFHGSQNLRRELGDDYVEWLKEEFGVGIKDYCVYWFRLAHDHLEPGHRAGLVGTNSVSQNRARGASLNYIAENGGVITDAVSKQKWPGEAVVNVSIVNWVKEPPAPPGSCVLDGVDVEGISTKLRPSLVQIEEVDGLAANSGRCFQGPIPAGSFYLEDEEAKMLLARSDAPYADVVRRYINGDDITEHPAQEPSRHITDFALRPLEEAMKYPAALDIVRTRVKPERETNNREAYRRYWWRFAEPRPKMRKALAPLSRFIAGNRIGKRFLFCWCDPSVCPSDLTIVFAFEDDYSMGILTSGTHLTWAMEESSTLRVDLRYTPTSAFGTFPWPEPDLAQRAVIGDLAKQVVERRQEICLEQEIGLTVLYNQVDEGAWTELRDLHRQLDEAVVVAYGWPAKLARDRAELKARLLALNQEIAAGQRPYDPFGDS